MNQNEYIYPFRKNAKGVHDITKTYVEKGDSIEKHIFDTIVLPHIKTLGNPKFVVDIGAGEGRYSQYFGTNAEQIVAIEPDEYRCEKTRENLKSMNTKTECIHGTVADAHIDEKSADLVVNIHVLQHIHPDDATAILDFAARTLRSGGFFVLAFTKKTRLDEDWNITWVSNNKSHYVEVPEEVFRLVSAAHLPTVLPVRKLHTDEILKELEQRGFSIEATKEYAPRFLGEKKKVIGKFFMWLYRHLPATTFHTMTKLIGYPLFEDIVVVAKKK
jgi:ubiquinone/menaquinone biosynthesis C-methylase UbiE